MAECQAPPWRADPCPMGSQAGLQAANIAIEHGPFIVDLHTRDGDFP